MITVLWLCRKMSFFLGDISGPKYLGCFHALYCTFRYVNKTCVYVWMDK